MTSYSTTLDTPVGRLTLIADDTALLVVHFHSSRHPAPIGTPNPRHPILRAAARQLVEYFDKRRRDFDLPLGPRGTPFQLKVWQELRDIPYGETRSYAQLARAIGQPAACRAVGRANGQNPIAIIIPCHRVIGADHSLTGFGGGLENKSTLLALENSLFAVTASRGRKDALQEA
jgi:methylated-DNA-[protein]-cysteine S-methyltransferase